MNHYPPPAKHALPSGLTELLAQLRLEDAFSAPDYVWRKGNALNAYLRASGLRAAVVAVSGGVDSALVLALVKAASQQPGSPIQRIVPVLLPVFTDGAATNQDLATSRGVELCGALELLPVVIDLSKAHLATKTLVDNALSTLGEGWASGQLVAYQRTPALYYVTSLLTQAGTPGMLIGTTNRDEGAYLGYFGKASDGLVDAQLISDLYKSQVYEVARHLGVPSSILEATPTGDMYDGRTDEEVFGASYDAVELFLREKACTDVARRIAAVGMADGRSDRFASQRAALEDLHRYNHHKYLGKSPAVHFDLWDCRIEGGWDYHVAREARQ
ncbi:MULTISPECIES: NAD(+) synthase [unclassified Variovorax]|uniref:NAD(+) synthase n=1 Tax=unclassified Variovorax TaxID=663243 RepID=UPI0008389D05|nr:MULTISPECIES: NAD(+) synthase [unclassified Variovorax]PNG50393.1 NH(3)-dependent NAD(+) synthetase [Variovorax sp. B2]PNG51266.1 NH(3)-dependent NAD(+) synthetase [Variovorax sp. B4]VTV17512.1 NH(3)-dependent NAD(+) synthetase [Variovorax sp. WDL1]